MKLSKGMIIKWGDTICRVLGMSEERAYILECRKKQMPKWISLSEMHDAVEISHDEFMTLVPRRISEEELSQKELATARHRYTLVAGILPFVDDDALRNQAINKISSENGISRRTLTTWLCDYLAYEDVAALANHRRAVKQKELTQDQKNMRWALNKFYYTRNGDTIAGTYVQMIKQKYTDENGKIFPEHPSIFQFRYFFQKTRKKQTEVISREGIKEYQLNYRPLLGEGVQDLAPNVGYGMLDGTICDIYLVDDAGNLVGRPILLACVDAYSGMCCGYSLLWEGGVYSVRELMLQTISDKAEWCSRLGIKIQKSQWPSSELPGVLITDRGSEYISYNFEQITELGVQVISLPSFSANLKGPVEKLFDLVQSSYKQSLKGKGVIEPDFQKRGMHDYRLDACLTMEQFEKIIIHCILYHNTQRVLENFPFSEDMLQKKVTPYANSIWEYGKTMPGANLVTVSKEQLLKTLLPRTEGRFTRKGLQANGLRYGCDGYTEQYLNGGTVCVAYNPDDVGYVFLVEDGYQKFDLIERRYEGQSVASVKQWKEEQNRHVKSYAEEQLQAKVDLLHHIETIADQHSQNAEPDLKGIRKNKNRARANRHRDLFKEVMNDDD